MLEVLLHEATKQAVAALLAQPSQAILLAGQQGAGKEGLAQHMAATYLRRPTDTTIENDQYYLQVVSDGKSIGIEQIREVQKFLALKTTGTATIRRVVVVILADTMTTEAQNALLKTLEEPPLDTVIIMTAVDTEKLLPTIRSRLRAVQLMPPSSDALRQHFTGLGYDAAAIAKAAALTNNSPGLMAAILADQSGHELLSYIDSAKALLGKTLFERLAMVDELSKDKRGLAELLVALKRICQGALRQATAKNQTKPVADWLRRLEVVTQAEELLLQNANAKLLLTDLMLNL